MLADWHPTTVGGLIEAYGGELQTGPFGSQLHAHDYLPNGAVAVIPTSAIGRRGIDARGVPRISRAKADELARHYLQAGDIVFARRGVQAAGLSALVTNDHAGALCGTGAIRLRLPSASVDATFLSFFLSADETYEWIRQHAIGATMPNLNEDVVRRIPVRLPPLAEQRRIAAILGALDDKIELNRKMNGTLEAMALAIFKSWFVDLGSVRAKVADLVRDGVLEIGDGYRAKNSELGTPGLPFIRAGDLNRGFDTRGAEVLRYESVAKAGRKLSRAGDVAFTSKGTVGRFARVAGSVPQFVYSPQVCFWRSLDHVRLHPAVLYCWMRSDDLKSQIDAVAGQTDMAPYVSLRDQRRMDVPVFPASQHSIAQSLEGLLTRRALADEESKTLAELRDGLLPKLLSGELRVEALE